MKTWILFLILCASPMAFSAISFDRKIITIEFAGEKFKFIRTKLGEEFRNIKVGDTVLLDVENPKVSTSK